jgi:hypothetical protein
MSQENVAVVGSEITRMTLYSGPAEARAAVGLSE